MSRKSWQESLRANLKRLQKPEQPFRLAVLGVGHELYGDDAVGVWLAGQLLAQAGGNSRLLAVEAGPAPENFTGLLRRFAPDVVLLVDAALMNLEPGGIGWLNWRDSTGFSASTHTLPLHILSGYLAAELGCEVDLIGIQPESDGIGEPLSPKVRQAALDVVQGILEVLEPAGI